MVIGGPDTGKSTFIKNKAKDLLGTLTAIVDLDSGQQSIGVPGTVAWCMASDFCGEGLAEPKDFFFTGATSPSPNIGRHLTGSSLICGKAKSIADKVLIDTSGLVARPLGTMLKQLKIELIKPDILVTFESGGELDELLLALRKTDRPEIIRLAASEKVNARSQKERRLWRKKAFRQYFADAPTVCINSNNVGILEANLRFRDAPTLKKPQDWFLDRFVGLQDAGGNFIGVGLVSEVTESIGCFKMFARVKDARRIKTIVFGQIKVSPSGKQLSYW